MRILACLVLFGAAFGCGSNTTSPDMTIDMAMKAGADLEKFSACGHPGDTGNSKHIGQYCDASTPCPGALICSIITNSAMPPDQQTFFCTTGCAKAGPDPATCGENAICQCRTIGCGCVPTSCLPAGMSG